MTGACIAPLPVRVRPAEPVILSPTLRRRYGSVTGLLDAAAHQLASHVAAGRMSRGVAEAAIWNTVLRAVRSGELRGDAVAMARTYSERLGRRAVAV